MSRAVPIDGTCDARFEPVRDLFSRSFEEGEVGGSVALVVEGELVVDLRGGYMDEARTRPWTRDTLVNVFSTTKGVTSLCIHRLIEEGRIDLDAPVARYWPEFAQKGKDRITVRHVLSHQAGVIAFGADIPEERSFDWDTLCDSLARAEPVWEPGSRHGYHAKTFGHLVGELVRRVDGRSLGTYLRDEIAGPFGLDFHIGLPDAEHPRCAELISQPPTPGKDPGGEPEEPPIPLLGAEDMQRVRTSYLQAFGHGFRIDANLPEWRRAEIPAGNGHGTAASLARIYGALARDGRLGGGELLSPRAIERATAQQSSGTDWVLLGFPTRFALGFALTPPWPPTPHPRAFGHPGMGGSTAFGDPDLKLGFAYVMNRMEHTLVGGNTGFRLMASAYRCLG